MRTSNPALNEGTFQKAASGELGNFEQQNVMTVGGTVNRSLMLLALVLIGAGWTWHLALQGNPATHIWMFGGLIVGLILALITIFKPTAAPITSPLYAAAEGLFLGAISAMFEAQFQGIVIQAVGLTFGTMFAMLIAYRIGLIRATEKFKAGVVAATGAVLLVYIATFVLGFFNVNIPYIHGSGPIGIGFSVVVVIIAALNLVLDFDLIETGAREGAPKFMEWYCAFALLVTLIWLYLEILRLLSKLRQR